jgi:hypothetical protein
MDTKYIHHMYLIPLFLVPSPPPLVPTLGKGLFFPSCPSGFNYILSVLTVQKALVFQFCIYHALIKLTPTATYSLSSCSP